MSSGFPSSTNVRSDKYTPLPTHSKQRSNQRVAGEREAKLTPVACAVHEWDTGRHSI